MALDSSLFGASIPAGTYAAGDRIPMPCIRGPAVVRSGYGAALLKKIFTVGTAGGFKIVVKNSNWVDSMSNPVLAMSETTLDDNSTSIQRGHDCDLMPNSSWEVYAEAYSAVTTTANTSIFALLDIDYPSVSSIANPRVEKGAPVTTDMITPTVTILADTADPATMPWTTFTVDILKAGYRYLLAQASFMAGAATTIGFIEISGAAGQNGLARIVPVRATGNNGIRYLIDYSTPLVKGPMNIAVAGMGTAGTTTPYLYLDWVKR